MEKLEVTRNAQTDQFSVVLSRGNDTIRCMVTVEAGRGTPMKRNTARLSQKLRRLRRLSTLQSRACGAEGNRLTSAIGRMSAFGHKRTWRAKL